MRNRYSTYWFFGAIMFFVIGSIFTLSLSQLYLSGYAQNIRQGDMPFDINLLWVAVGMCLVMTVVCLNFSQPLDLHNYVSRLEREIKGLKKALECYDADCEHADKYRLAGKALDRCGRLADLKIHYLDERREA